MHLNCRSKFGRLHHVLVRHPLYAFRSQAHLHRKWQHFGFSAEPDFRQSCQDFDDLVDLLERFGATVHFLDEESDSGLDSIYVHDPAITIGDGMVIGRMGKPERFREPDSFRNLCQRHDWKILGQVQPPGRLEGGDVIWLDPDTLAIGLGYRTNESGVGQLERFADGTVHDVVRVHLPYMNGPTDVLHLMSLISPIGRSTAVIYKKLLPVTFIEDLQQRDYQFIEVPDEEFDSLGCNVLSVSPNAVIMAEGNPITQSRIEAKGIEVLTYRPRDISLKGFGGPTCLTRPLVRG